MFKFLVRLIGDFFYIHKSPKESVKNNFAFIVHPRGYGDIVGNIPFLRVLPRNFVMKLFRFLWPFTVSEIKGLKSLKDGADLKGWVIGVPLLGHQMMENRLLARKKILQAIKLARNRGARIIGLGALTGSVMEGGAGLSKKNRLTITAGRAYTAFTVKSYVEDAIKTVGLLKQNVVVAVIGAAGGVGKALIRLIAGEPFKKIILIDLERKLDKIQAELSSAKLNNIEITHQIGKAKNADVIITVTNAPEAVLSSDDIKPGAIIIDDAQPSDIPQEIISSRDDIIVIEAGVIIADQISVGANFRLANKNETYCCLGEVMAIAASGWDSEYQPNEIVPEIVNEISEIAGKLGFKLAPYQAFGKLVSVKKIEKVRQIIQKSN